MNDIERNGGSTKGFASTVDGRLALVITKTGFFSQILKVVLVNPDAFWEATNDPFKQLALEKVEDIYKPI